MADVKMFLLALLGVMCVTVYCGDDEKIKNPLDYLSNPKLAAALEAAAKLKELIHSTSSSHITKREKTSGFEFLKVRANAVRTKGIPKKYFLKYIARKLKPFNTNKDMKEVVDTFIDFIKYDVDEHQEQFFAIVSNKGSGKIQAIFVYFKKVENTNKYNFRMLSFQGAFRLAADLVITRSSKSNFFSSSSKDIIRYLPRRGVTAKDINDLLSIIVPKIAVVMNDFVPPGE